MKKITNEKIRKLTIYGQIHLGDKALNIIKGYFNAFYNYCEVKESDLSAEFFKDIDLKFETDYLIFFSRKLKKDILKIYACC